MKHNEAKGLCLMDTAHLLRSMGRLFPNLAGVPPSRSDQEFRHTAEKLNMCFGDEGEKVVQKKFEMFMLYIYM